MGKYNVSVVIPNYNGSELLRKNLPALIAASKYASNNIIEIIVVDDGSKDSSVKLLNSEFPGVKVIKHRINRGFSAAVNTGVRAAKGNLVLLMNTDVVPTRKFLVPVIKHFDDEKVFAVSLHEKGYGSAKASFSRGFIELAMEPEGSSACQSFYVSGGSGIFRRSIWIKLGGMDEKLFSPFYWEDIDICYRAAKRGYLNLWIPEGIVEHNHESTITKFSRDYVARVRERNQLLMIWKDITSMALIKKHIFGILRRVIQHPGYIRVVILALLRLRIVLSGRSKEVKQSKISDEAIFARF
jgi:GT2 family glycosyltransferase